MLIADIKNKLSLSELSSEDFLTSSVFTVLRILPSEWITKFLSTAVNIHSQRFEIKIKEPVYQFWPWLNINSSYTSGAEPDLVILSQNHAIIIEAKNYANKSGTGVVLKHDETSPEKVQVVDQLAREYFAGSNCLIGTIYDEGQQFTIQDITIIYLTRHDTFPKNDIEETINSISKISITKAQDASNKLYWTNWQKLMPLLETIISSSKSEPHQQLLSTELYEFLNRRGLSCFNGFRFLKKIDAKLLTRIQEKNHIFYHQKKSKYWSHLLHPTVHHAFTAKRTFYTKNNNYWESLQNYSSNYFSKHNFYSRVT